MSGSGAQVCCEGCEWVTVETLTRAQGGNAQIARCVRSITDTKAASPSESVRERSKFLPRCCF